MTTAVYIRVSSLEQVTASQDREVTRWLKKEDITDFERYVDHETGTKMKRPAIDRLMSDINAGKIDRIVIWRMDRLGRTAAGLTALFETLNAKCVTLVSIRDHFDLATPSGRLMANVLASVAQFETEVRRERQMAGIAVAKTKGKYKGRKPGSYKSKPYKAHRMKERGFSVTEIARQLNVSRFTIHKYLLLNGEGET